MKRIVLFLIAPLGLLLALSGCAAAQSAPQNAPLVAELQRALVRLGRGDARLGVARALALLQREPGRASR